MSDADFIETYDGALDPALCRRIIEHFERSGQAIRGATGGGVNLALKNSWDVTITGRPDWLAFDNAIQNAIFAGLQHYVHKYRYALIAPLSLQYKDPASGALQPITYDNLDTMPAAIYAQLLNTAFRPGTVNVQKYQAGVGGYPYWHCEHYPKDPQCDALHRVLLYSIYLNDAFSAGETEFFYQQRKIAPKTGTLLIAPAGFTHTHRGNMPTGGDKYIATSWILFQRAEKLFPARA